MAKSDEYQELAGSLASGDMTVSQSHVVQGDELRQFLGSLPPKSPLPAVLDYWLGLQNSDRIPARRDLDPTAMDSATLPHIVIIDVEEEPQRRFRYRMVGTAVGTIFGADYSGRYMDELGLGDVFARVVTFYTLICNDPQPAQLKGSYETRSGLTFDVARLAMPLSEDGKHIDSLFCAFDKS